MNSFADYKTARIVEKREETVDVFTYRLRFEDQTEADSFAFQGGQFNMVYLFGVGEVPISIMSDPDDKQGLDHTIRIVGRVTKGIEKLNIGDQLSIRGPFGRGWPLEEAKGKDIVVITGGLGCAPVVGAVEYIFRRREYYGHIKIMHGVKTPRDMMYQERFVEWAKHDDTQVLLASDQPGKTWHNHVGVVTELFDMVEINPDNTVVMMCGPEMMMQAGAKHLAARGVPAAQMYLSMERNMQCGVGLCGHCQVGPYFCCKDGPVMTYAQIAPYLGV